MIQRELISGAHVDQEWRPFNRCAGFPKYMGGKKVISGYFSTMNGVFLMLGKNEKLWLYIAREYDGHLILRI